jgi:phospholipid/cholesterol/gamma-HCH transport system permease protein
MLPLLTIAANTIGLLGGLFIAVEILGINGNVYLNSVWNGLTYTDLLGGLLKPLVFGTAVALVGCHCGLRTSGGTQGVGQSTTQSVVAASILILFFNLILTRIIWPPS